MKKKIFATVMLVAIVLSIAAVPAMAADIQATPNETSPVATGAIISISFTGNSGTRYSVNFTTQYVGYNYITTGNVVKVCQAYCQIAGYSPQGIDGIYGQNTYSAIYSFQTAKGLSKDGICGDDTWNAFYSATGGISTALKNLL